MRGVRGRRGIQHLHSVFTDSGWELLEAPRTALPREYPAYHAYGWHPRNLLILDPRRVIMERAEEPLICALRDWGLEPVPGSFRNAAKYSGGGFHCLTLDIRRRGRLESYFN